MSDLGGRPYLPSAIALVGLAIITAVTAFMGFDYWAWRRGDFEMALINLGCEMIAFGGLAAAMFGWPHRRVWVATGIFIAVSMSTVCGWTAYQRLAEDEHMRAVAAIEVSDRYKTAVSDAAATRANIQAWSRDDVRPACACPDTFEKWAEAHRLEADRLERVLSARQGELRSMTPAPRVSPVALVRALGLELAKLLGFGAFGGVWIHALRGAPARHGPARQGQASLEGRQQERSEIIAASGSRQRLSSPASLKPRAAVNGGAKAAHLDLGDWDAGVD